MIRKLLVGALLFVGAQSFADVAQVQAISQSTLQNVKPAAMLNWTVGSTTDHNLNMGMISGTMHAIVREETAQGFWIQQDMDLGFMGAQKVETHINKDTGEIIELLVNGEKQTPPDASQTEIVESRRESVTVPKGTFESVWVKLRDKKDNKESQVWINPTIVPMGGMIKTIAPGPMGEVVVELTDFLVK